MKNNIPPPEFEKLCNLYKDYIELSQADFLILKGRIPDLIFSQLKHITSEIRLLKNQDFSFLKSTPHTTDNFNYKTFIPDYILNPTFVSEYIRYLGVYFVSKYFQYSFSEAINRVKFNKVNYNAFNDYLDIWINYSSKTNYSNNHTHNSDLAGVIFVENTEVSNTIFSPNLEIKGIPGEVLIFPSNLIHRVTPNLSESERVTVAFNLIID